MDRQARYDPGPGGYAVAVGVSAVTFAGLLWIVLSVVGRGQAQPEVPPSAPDAGASGDSFVQLLALVCVVAVPVGLVAVPIVHAAVRDRSRQWEHVGASALMGLVVGSLPTAVLFSPWLLVPALLLSLSCGIGRFAVIPIARARYGQRVLASYERAASDFRSRT